MLPYVERGRVGSVTCSPEPPRLWVWVLWASPSPNTLCSRSLELYSSLQLPDYLSGLVPCCWFCKKCSCISRPLMRPIVTHATHVRCYLFREVFLVPSTPPSPRLDYVSLLCAPITPCEVPLIRALCGQRTHLSWTLCCSSTGILFFNLVTPASLTR